MMNGEDLSYRSMGQAMLILVALMPPAPASAQTAVIELDSVVTIGNDGSPGVVSISGSSTVAVDRRGRFLISGRAAPEIISVFDSTGAFLRTLGRQGEGPGEYRQIRQIAVGEKYIHVFDRRNGRRTMLDHDFNVVRTDPVLGDVQSSVVLSGDRVLFFADIPTYRLVGRPLHILHVDGSTESFGGEGEVYQGGLPFMWIGQGRSDQTAWTLEAMRYRLTEWDLRARIALRQLTPERDWFQGAMPDEMAYPRPMLFGVRQDEQGRVWIHGGTNDPDWTTVVRPGDRLPEVRPGETADGVLEVLDPATGAVIAFGRWDHTFMRWVNGADLIASSRETELGERYYVIYRPRLVFDEPRYPPPKE